MPRDTKGAENVRKVVWLPNDGPRPDRYDLSRRRLDALKSRSARWTAPVQKQPSKRRGPPTDERILINVMVAIASGATRSQAIAAAVSMHKNSVNSAIQRLISRGLVQTSRVLVGKAWANESRLTPSGLSAIAKEAV